MDTEAEKNLSLWLNGPYDEETKQEIRRLLKQNPQAVEEAFFTHLTFGTGGLRGMMGLGSNRMNVYTIRSTTQGLANYMVAHKGSRSLSTVIGYDARHHSRLFAEETAKVLAGNGIKVYLFRDIRPTPLVSFACRHKQCLSAVMITASHNPAAYNGYKVYWSDGGQVVPPQDMGIIQETLKIHSPADVKSVPSLIDPLIEEIGEEIDALYIQTIRTLQNYPETNREKGGELSIIYTSLHGTGATMVPKTLADWGFDHLCGVGPQMIPDGSFPTVKSPNPEEAAALEMGTQLLMDKQADILIATDPDADRVAAVVMHKQQPVALTGNQIAAICLNHVCEALFLQKKLPEKAAFVKSIGTTELFQAICDHYQRPCFNVLTGFKYIAEKIRLWENDEKGLQYIFGGEESYGYLLGTFARDKDAISSSALICEAALKAKLEGKTLLDKLYELYTTYGIYQEELFSLNFGETKEGKEQMNRAMQQLRTTAPRSMGTFSITAVEDYLLSKKTDLATGTITPLTLPQSDVLLYWLEDGSKLMIRPSGTEPKVKIYCGGVNKKFTDIPSGIIACQEHCSKLLEEAKKILLNKKNRTLGHF